MITNKDINKKNGALLVNKLIYEGLTSDGKRMTIYVIVQSIDSTGAPITAFSFFVRGVMVTHSPNLNDVLKVYNQLIDPMRHLKEEDVIKDMFGRVL